MDNKVSVKPEEYKRLKREARLGTISFVIQILSHPLSIGILCFLGILLWLNLVVYGGATFNHFRTDLSLGNFLPMGDYAGMMGDKAIAFNLNKETNDWRTKGYDVLITIEGEEEPARYRLYFDDGRLHLSEYWGNTSKKALENQSVIVKNEDGSFSVLQTKNGPEQMRFSPSDKT